MAFSKDLFISSTFWDDAASLAAAIATITKMRELGVAERIRSYGCRYVNEWQELARRHNVDARIAGDPASTVTIFGTNGALTQRQQATLYIQEMARRGVFSGGGFNLCYAHQDAEIDTILAAADDALGVIRKALDDGDAAKYLFAEEQKPLFQRRMV